MENLWISCFFSSISVSYNQINSFLDENIQSVIDLDFNGSFSATFPNNSKIVKNLLKKRKLNVQFFESPSGYNFKVNIKKLKKTDPIWKFTYYHNCFFNSSLDENIEILLFNPDKISFKKIY